MAAHADMKRLGDDADAVRRLATFLLAVADADWTAWEQTFLETLAERREPLTMRQREVLVELRDSAQSLRSVHGFSIAMLIRDCWLNRLDLDDDEQAFIERLKAEAPATLKRRAAMRLFACAQQLDVVPQFARVG